MRIFKVIYIIEWWKNLSVWLRILSRSRLAVTMGILFASNPSAL